MFEDIFRSCGPGLASGVMLNWKKSLYFIFNTSIVLSNKLICVTSAIYNIIRNIIVMILSVISTTPLFETGWLPPPCCPNLVINNISMSKSIWWPKQIANIGIFALISFCTFFSFTKVLMDLLDHLIKILHHLFFHI